MSPPGRRACVRQPAVPQPGPSRPAKCEGVHRDSREWRTRVPPRPACDGPDNKGLGMRWDSVVQTKLVPAPPPAKFAGKFKAAPIMRPAVGEGVSGRRKEVNAIPPTGGPGQPRDKDIAGGRDRGRERGRVAGVRRAYDKFPTGVVVSAAHLCAGSEPARLGHHARTSFIEGHSGRQRGTTSGRAVDMRCAHLMVCYCRNADE